MPQPAMEKEEDLRERCFGLSNAELVEEAVSALRQLAEMEHFRVDLAAARARKEQAERKAATLEAESHTLLSRAMEAEERLVSLSKDRDQLASENEKLRELSVRGGKEWEELSNLRGELVELRGFRQQAINDRRKVEEHNEMRAAVERSFNALTKQHELLNEELAAAHTEVKLLRLKAKDDVLRMQVLVEEKDQLARNLLAANTELHNAKEGFNRTEAELAELRKASQGWKRDAERAVAVEAKCESLLQEGDRHIKRAAQLQDTLRRLQEDAAKLEEEKRLWAAEKRKDKAAMMLKEELAELQQRYVALHARERDWLAERAELAAKLKRLQAEHRMRNPSQLRMMEIEVQNELLLEMLQRTGNNNGGGTSSPSPGRTRGGESPAPSGSPTHRRPLPPLDAGKASPANQSAPRPSEGTSPASPPRMKREAARNRNRRPHDVVVGGDSDAELLRHFLE